MSPQLSRRTERLSSSLIRDILKVTQRPGVISFAGGLPADDLMPKLDFAQLGDALRQYGPSEGEPELRDGVAQGLTQLGINCHHEQVLITSGSQQGIDLVAKLFIDEGSPILLESPSYLAAIQTFQLYGPVFHGLPLAADGIDPDELRAAIRSRRPAFVYLIPTFQNPTGHCYSDDVRRAVAAVLDETGVPLIEDDPYRDLVYGDVQRTPICAYLTRAPWVYLGSFSKIAAPGLRIGYMASSPSLFAMLVRLKQASDLHSNRIGQAWVAGFLADPQFAEHLQRLARAYADRRDAMEASLQRHFQHLATWQAPSGGLFFWLRLIADCDTMAALQSALARDVAFMPGDPFFPVAAQRYPAMRLNFSHAAPDKIEQGIALLADILAKHM